MNIKETKEIVTSEIPEQADKDRFLELAEVIKPKRETRQIFGWGRLNNQKENQKDV